MKPIRFERTYGTRVRMVVEIEPHRAPTWASTTGRLEP